MNKKAINFDLDTKKLREFHPKGITQAYTDIRNFLESMGFEHDWLSKCVKEIDVTDVGKKYYSLLDTVCGKGSIVKDILEEKDEIDLDIDITDDFFDIDK